jgi:hypothetical protein
MVAQDLDRGGIWRKRGLSPAFGDSLERDRHWIPRSVDSRPEFCQSRQGHDIPTRSRIFETFVIASVHGDSGGSRIMLLLTNPSEGSERELTQF